MHGVSHTWDFLATWTIDPVVIDGILLTALLYLWGVLIVGSQRTDRSWPRGKTVCFMSGLATVWIALLGPIGSFDGMFFWAHMTQHMLLMMIAAPLIILGDPVLLIMRVASKDVRRRRLVPLLRSRVVRICTDPVLTWLVFAGVLVGAHFSGFYNYALDHEWAHTYIEHPMFLGAALLYFYPILGSTAHRLSAAGKIISLLAMMVPEAMTGFFLYASPYVMYPHYALQDPPFGLEALPDQQLGGALMWAGSMLIDTAWVALAAREWLRADARRTRRVDQGLLPLTSRSSHP